MNATLTNNSTGPAKSLMSRRNLFRLSAAVLPVVAGLGWPTNSGTASASAADNYIEIIDAVSQTAFAEFAPGSVQPRGLLEGGTNVGPRVALTRYDGDITIGAGQVVSGLDIYGRVTFTGPGVLRDCVIRGWTSQQYSKLTSPVGIVTGKNFNLNGGLIEWCRIDGSGRESLWANGISGGNYTARYCEITRTNDGISGVLGGNATVECCRIWNGYYTAWHNDATGGAQAGWPSSPSDHRTHGDAVQIHQYAGWVIRGCYLGGRPVISDNNVVVANRDPSKAAAASIIRQVDSGTDFPNACFMVSSSSAAAKVGLLIEKNWMSGSTARININTVPSLGDYMAGVTVRDNRFIRSDWKNPGYYIYCKADFQGAMSNNVFDDNGAAVPVVKY